MEQSQFAEFKSVGRKGILLLNHPPLNILTEAMCEELTGFLETFPVNDFDDLLITSEGKHFSAGADIDEHLPDKVGAMLPVFHKLLLTLATFPLPTTAAIHGACHGGGLEVARACRKVIAWNPKEKLRLSLPEIIIGCFPPFGLAVFPRLLSNLNIIRFLLTGQLLKGENLDDLNRARNIGLVDVTFSGTLDELINHVDFSQVARMPSITDYFKKPYPIDRSAVKKILASEDMSGISTHALNLATEVLIRCAEMTDFESALKFAEEVYLRKLVPHPDYTEGLRAFMEKRKPDFKATGMQCREDSGG